MPQPNDLSRLLAALDGNSTVIAVIEMCQSSWFVAGIVPGVERHPLKKLVRDAEALLLLLEPWRDEATKADRTVTRIAVAFEVGRDGPVVPGTHRRCARCSPQDHDCGVGPHHWRGQSPLGLRLSPCRIHLPPEPANY